MSEVPATYLSPQWHRDLRRLADRWKEAHDLPSIPFRKADLFEELVAEINSEQVDAEGEDPLVRRANISLALMLSPEQGPPPQELQDLAAAIVAGLRDTLDADEPEQLRRVPEVIVATALGWNPLEAEPPTLPRGLVSSARYEVWDEISDSVRSILLSLARRVKGFEKQKPSVEFWTDRVFYQFISGKAPCRCWTRAVKGDPEWLAEVTSLDELEEYKTKHLNGKTSNGYRKGLTCFQWHNIRSFEPSRRMSDGSRTTLWAHLHRAVKGFIGNFDQRVGGFPAGILYSLLREQFPLELVAVVEHYCPHCRNWTVCQNACPDCGVPFEPRRRTRATKGRVILDSPEGGFEERMFWTCKSDPCQEVDGHKFPRQVFAADESSTVGAVEACTYCSHPQPRGRGHRPSKLFVYDPAQSPTEQPATSASGDADQKSNLLTRPCIEAIRQFQGWQQAIVIWMLECFEAGDARAIALVQAEGNIDWPSLYKTLQRVYQRDDLPNDHAELQTQYEQQLKPQLVQIFRNFWDKAESDWRLLEAWSQ